MKCCGCRDMMKVASTLFLLFAVTYGVLVEAENCPHGWLDRSGSATCYSFRFKQKKSWSDARLECQRYDGDLLKIETDKEKVWVLSQVRHIENITLENDEWWTGLNNREQVDVNKWFWADGVALEPNLLQWAQGEPNNYMGQEHCAEIWQGVLNDTNCDHQLYYICERPKSVPLSCDVDNGWEHLGENCFKSMPITRNYEDATHVCTQYDASLVDIFNEEMQQLVTDMAKHNGRNSWLGLRVVHDWNGNMVLEWTNGSSPVKTWWSDSENSNHTLSNTSSCVILNATKNGLQNWEYAECTEGSSFLCTKQSGLCSDGWVQRQGHCYFFFSQKTMSWKDSVAFCNLRGAMLIQMNSGDNIQFLSTEIQENFGQDVDSMWIGISGKDGSWSWLSGDAANITGSTWAENAMQTDTNASTKCAYILRDDRNLKWQTSADCLTERGVICTAPSNVLVHPPPPVFPELKCRDNWLARIPNCFRVNTEPVTWFEARMKCQQDGGDLAVIADEQDQKFLLSYIQQEVWIGLNDREQENKFVWLDQNDQVSLTYWRHGDPDNKIIGNMYSENCVAMVSSIGTQDHGKWIDYPCAFKLGYVCQRMAVRNIAVGKTAKQSSFFFMYVASFAVDNNIGYNLTHGNPCSRTSREFNPWWEVDLGTRYNIGSVVIHHRMDNEICLHRKQNLRILLKNDTSETGIMIVQDQHCLPLAVITAELSPSISARYVRIDVPDRMGYLTLCEVEVFEAIPGQQSQSTTSPTEITRSNSTDCGGSWTQSLETGQCYRKGNDKLTWTDAKEACHSWKATLVPVQSAQEGLFLAGLAQTEENLWIGVSAIPADSSVWLTVDRTTVSFSEWGTGEPVNKDPESNSSTWTNKHRERYQRKAYCVLKSVPRKTWQTVSCQRRESYICLKRVESLPACSDEWIADLSIKTCYKFEKTLRNWHGAESACKTWNSHLVHLKSETIYNFVIDTAQKLQDISDGIWIGLHDSQVEGNWTWSDGTPFLLKKWAPKQPDDWKGNEDCGGITRQNYVNDYFCTENLASVCERPAFQSAACDPGWELDPNTGICFKFGYEKKTWNEARSACQKFGGDLATVKSPDEQLYIYNRVHGITKSQGCWIGASDTTIENIWKGVDGSHLTYTDWGQDEPNNMYITENCASIRLGLSPNHGRWNDQNCTLMLPYVCEKSVFDLITSSKTNTTTISTTTTSTTEEKIPDEDYPDYIDLPSTTMAWDSRCGNMFKASYFKEFCYQISDFRATWQDARTKCQQDEGDLLSITSKNEELYIVGNVRSRSLGDFWIGANDHGTEGIWRWSNGDPYFYFNWNSGEPSNGGSGEDCGAIMNRMSYKWNDMPCNHQLGYICKKKAFQRTSTHIPSEKATNNSETGSIGCLQNWLEYGSRCYLIVQERSNWDTALKSCRQKGGDLASVANQEQQNFIFSQLPKVYIPRRMYPYSHRHPWTRMIFHDTFFSPPWYPYFDSVYERLHVAPVDGFWIGMSMRDRQTAKFFQWSDNSTVTFTTWSENEPNNYNKKERVCVTIGQQTGLWADEDCSNDETGYICKMERISRNSTSLSPVVRGCSDDKSIGYASSCYKFVDYRKSWNNAQEYCAKEGGNLAVIMDSHTQAFLSSEMTRKYPNYWIGLRKLKSTRMYQWINGGAVTYTSWYKDFTGNEDTSCVSIRALSPYGLWETENCSLSLPYICQMPWFGSTLSSRLTTSVTTTEAPCSSGWSLYDRFCYKISNNEETWFDARTSCLKQGADLTSITNDSESKFIKNLLSLSTHAEIWLGLNILDEDKGYMWSDGSALTYTQWSRNEPNDFNGNEKCVECFRWNMLWNDNNCFKSIGYICKKARGVDALEEEVMETTPETVSCGTDLPWKYYKDYCYYTSSSSVKKTWRSARAFCMAKGAELASIHSQMENNIIFSAVSRLDSKAWIGLNEFGIDELSYTNYVWSDKTAVNFFNWAFLEPDDANFRATCVTMDSGGGLWFDENCGIKLPFVCKRRYSKVTPLPSAPTQVAAGGCPPDFLIFGSKCFLIRSTARYDFDTARNACIQYRTGFNLASINSRLEQMFLVLHMREAGGSSAFIGLNDLQEDGQYDWLDNSPVSYINFRAGQPSLHARENCVEMFSDGTWNNLNCASLRGFICQGPRDSNLPEPTPTIPTSHCPAGYTVYSSTEQCYRILNSTQSWNESLTLCQADGATLATIADLYDMYFLEMLSNTKAPNETSLWIGLTDFKETGVFQWISGATVTYTKWDYGEPSLQENMCVAMHKGAWRQVSCDSSQPAICQTVGKSTELSRRTTVSTQQVVCSNSSVAFSTKCYLVVLDMSVDWFTARDMCRDSGMRIASIHSRQESEFIKDLMLAHYRDSPVKSVWIGLVENRKEGWFIWTDNTPINFFNWDDNEPNMNNETLACAELSALTGSWYDDDCNAGKGFVCKGDPALLGKTDESSSMIIVTGANTENAGMTLAPGQIVGIIVGILGALVILQVCVYLYQRGKYRAFIVFLQGRYRPAPVLANVDRDSLTVEMDATRVGYDQ